MDIYVFQNGEQRGPFSRRDVFQEMQDGRLSPDDLAWHEGMEDWKPLGSLLRGMVSVPVALAEPVAARPRYPSPARSSQVPVGRVRTKSGARWLVTLALIGLVVAGAAWARNNPAEMRALIARGEQLIAPMKPVPATVQPAGASLEAPRAASASAVKPLAPAPAAVPRTETLDLAALASSPARWPGTVVLRKPATFRVTLDGRIAGSIQLPAGSEVNVKAVAVDALTVERNGSVAKIPVADTDLAERVRPSSPDAPPAPAAGSGATKDAGAGTTEGLFGSPTP